MERERNGERRADKREGVRCGMERWGEGGRIMQYKKTESKERGRKRGR